MKLLYSALAGSAAANWLTIQNDFKSLYGGAVVKPQTITPDDMGLLNEYGCWCFFAVDDIKAGRSHPVDLIDSFCKRLHDGYECAMLDAAAMGESCVPWAIEYESAIGTGVPGSMTIDNIRDECSNQNPTVGCAQWTCMIEGYFVTTLFLAFTHGTEIDDNMRHANGFDFDDSCPVNKGVKSEKECCSEHPVRFPYKTYGGARDCCIDKTFNAGILNCCPDGVVRMSCP